jgi:hypothetical protein
MQSAELLLAKEREDEAGSPPLRARIAWVRLAARNRTSVDLQNVRKMNFSKKHQDLLWVYLMLLAVTLLLLLLYWVLPSSKP